MSFKEISLSINLCPCSKMLILTTVSKNMTVLFINYWRAMEDRYCAGFLPFYHLTLAMSTSFSCSRHCCMATPPPDRMRSLASQQIMWRTRVVAEDGAMSHKGPLWVPEYDNIRKCRKEEVSAGSWLPHDGLWRKIALIFSRGHGVTPSSMTLMLH